MPQILARQVLKSHAFTRWFLMVVECSPIAGVQMARIGAEWRAHNTGAQRSDQPRSKGSLPCLEK